MLHMTRLCMHFPLAMHARILFGNSTKENHGT